MEKKILVIVGPTSSGKTALALSIARMLQCQTSLISVDSRQNYQDLSVLSGKDKPENIPDKISYLGADDLLSREEQNIATFSKRYLEQINQDQAEGKQIILVGGSGLFIKSLTSNLDLAYYPRNEVLRKELEHLSVAKLQEKLFDLDPATYSSLNNSDRNNPRRLVRKIEIATYREIIDIPTSPVTHKFIWIGLKISPNTLIQKISKRIGDRISAGVINEVDDFRKSHHHPSPQITSTLGYQEICDYLDKKVSIDEMKNKWRIKEVNYAKRQMVWFKKQESIIWYDESINRLDLAKKIVSMLNENFKA